MQIEVRTEQPLAIRITLEGKEVYHLKVALERACYMDTAPEDQAAVNQFAEGLLRGLHEHLPEE